MEIRFLNRDGVRGYAAIYLLVLGAFFLFSRKDKKRGLILIVSSVVYFAIAVAIVNSFGLGVLEDRFANLCYSKDGSFLQVIRTIITNPAYALGQTVANKSLSQMDKLRYIIDMLVPMAAVFILTGKKYSRYILVLPFVVLNVSVDRKNYGKTA